MAKLDISTVENRDGMIHLSGQNGEGAYFVEFPEFSFVGSHGSLRADVKIYLEKVREKSKEYTEYLDQISREVK